MTDAVEFPGQDGAGTQAGRVLFGSLMTVGLVTATVAVLCIWVFLTEPVELARTVRQGNTLDMARVLASAVYDLVTSLLAWL